MSQKQVYRSLGERYTCFLPFYTNKQTKNKTYTCPITML